MLCIYEALGFVINRASIIMRKKLTALLKEAGYDITPEEFVILSRLWEENGLFQTEISERKLKDKTRVTRLLGSLMDKALIEKKTEESDRRNFRIHLTKKGKDLKYDLLPIIINLICTSSNNISQSDLEITIKTLNTIFTNLNCISNE